MKTLIKILLVFGFIGNASASTITFEMIRGFSPEDTGHFDSETEMIVHSENEENIIISVKSYFSDLKNENLFSDGQKRKLFLVSKETNKVLDSYPYAFGYLRSFIKKNDYYIITDMLSRGGSGGSDNFGTLKVLIIENGKFKSLFDEVVAYVDDGAVGSDKFDMRVSIAVDNKLLLLDFDKNPSSCSQVPFGLIESDLYGMFSFVMSECISSNDGVILFDLQNYNTVENDKSIGIVKDVFREHLK